MNLGMMQARVCEIIYIRLADGKATSPVWSSGSKSPGKTPRWVLSLPWPSGSGASGTLGVAGAVAAAGKQCAGSGATRFQSLTGPWQALQGSTGFFRGRRFGSALGQRQDFT